MAGSLADEFDKFTKDMTAFPEPFLVLLCVDEGAEHRAQASTRNTSPQHIETSFLEFAIRADVIALMDALKILTAVLAGYDWGGRAVEAYYPCLTRSPSVMFVGGFRIT